MTETKHDEAPAGAGIVSLDKTIKAVLAFCSGDVTRHMLQCVHITPEYAEATDSYRIVRMTHAPFEGEFPRGPHGNDHVLTSEIPAEGISILGSAIKRALSTLSRRRSSLPVFSRIPIRLAEGNLVTLTTTDPDFGGSIEHTCRRELGTLPPIDRILEETAGREVGARISLSVGLLESTCKALRDFGSGYLTLEIAAEPLKPVRITAENGAKQRIEIVQMPVNTMGDAS